MLEASVEKGRSKLYLWLSANHADIASVLEKQRRPSWQALARTAHDSGLGNPSRQTVRKAWMRVVEDKEREANGSKSASRAGRSAPHLPAPTASALPAAPPQREQTAYGQPNPGAGTRAFKHNPAPKIDPDEWGPAKK